MRDPIADLSGLPACSTYTSPQLVPTPPVVKIECLLDKLTPEQVNVLKTLWVGRSIAEAAESEHVHRGTIHRWLKHDPHFRAAFNAWKEETLESARALMVRMVPPAMETLLSCVMKGQFQAAVTVLKTMGILDKQVPGLTDPELLGKKMEVDRRQQRADVHKRAIETFVDETSCLPDVADKTMQEIFKLVDEDEKDNEPDTEEGVEEDEEMEDGEMEDSEQANRPAALTNRAVAPGGSSSVAPKLADGVSKPEVPEAAAAAAGAPSLNAQAD